MAPLRRGAADVAAIKGLATVPAVLAAHGLPAARRGPCPLHGGDNPSAFSAREDTWACWTHCGSGDVIALVQRLQGVPFHGALDWLQRFAGSGGSYTYRTPPRPPDRRDGKPERDPTESCRLQGRVHAVLLDRAPLGAEGRAYLRKTRGFADDEIPGDLCLLPPPADQRPVVAAIVAELGADGWRASGLADPNDPARFRWPSHRLVLPYPAAPDVLAEAGWLQRRALDGRTPRYVGPDGLAAHWPYGAGDFLETAGPDTPVVLVEGVLDAIAARALLGRADQRVAALGLPGALTWCAAWDALVAGRTAYLALDGDDAGNRAALKLAPRLRALGCSVRRVVPARGDDWCDQLGAGPAERAA